MNTSTTTTNHHRAAAAPIPVGNYLAHVIAKLWDTAKTGNYVLKLAFMIDDGPQSGQTVNFSMTFTGETTNMCERVMRAIGLDPTRPGFTNATVADMANRVRIEVEHENGETKTGEPRIYARVKYVNSLVAGYNEPTDVQLQKVERDFFSAQREAAKKTAAHGGGFSQRGFDDFPGDDK